MEGATTRNGEVSANILLRNDGRNFADNGGCCSATPVAFARAKSKSINIPDHPPPAGYLCYRCREKGVVCLLSI
jgi:hypothetical protein